MPVQNAGPSFPASVHTRGRISGSISFTRRGLRPLGSEGCTCPSLSATGLSHASLGCGFSSCCHPYRSGRAAPFQRVSLTGLSPQTLGFTGTVSPSPLASGNPYPDVRRERPQITPELFRTGHNSYYGYLPVEEGTRLIFPREFLFRAWCGVFAPEYSNHSSLP
jgi:hypothetical protein